MVFFPSHMDADEAAARPTRGSRRLDGRRGEGEAEAGGGGGEEAWRAAAGSGRGGRGDRPRRGRGARRSSLPLQGCAARIPASAGAGPLPGRPSHAALRPGRPAREPSPCGRRPRDEAAAAQRPDASGAALAPVGIRTRRGRELASITAALPEPPCWEETTRHAAAERLQRRKRRQRQALPAQSGRGAGRQGAEGGGRSGPSRSALRRPGGAPRPPAFACRAAWGVAGGLRGLHCGGDPLPAPQLPPVSRTPG